MLENLKMHMEVLTMQNVHCSISKVEIISLAVNWLNIVRIGSERDLRLRDGFICTRTLPLN